MLDIWALTFQKTKFGHITREIFFLRNHAENTARRLVSDFFFFRKISYDAKASGLQLDFNIDSL